MKIYPKTYEDICDFSKREYRLSKVKSNLGSVDELISSFRSFYREAHNQVFDQIVKEVWLEQQIIFNGKRKVRRRGNGIMPDILFGFFMKAVVGISQRSITANFSFTPVSTYLIDFFPDFLLHDPFKEPDYYKYPYKHVTLDHLLFVYQMDNRLELLEEADRRSMSYGEFINWALNWALCYNDDIGKVFYTFTGGHLNWPYIRKNKLKNFWENEKYKFRTK